MVEKKNSVENHESSHDLSISLQYVYCKVHWTQFLSQHEYCVQ